MTEHVRAALLRHDPRPIDPRRPVTHVLIVPALELRHPVLFVVEMKAGDALVHGRVTNAELCISRAERDPSRTISVVSSDIFRSPIHSERRPFDYGDVDPRHFHHSRSQSRHFSIVSTIENASTGSSGKRSHEICVRR